MHWSSFLLGYLAGALCVGGILLACVIYFGAFRGRGG